MAWELTFEQACLLLMLDGVLRTAKLHGCQMHLITRNLDSVVEPTSSTRLQCSALVVPGCASYSFVFLCLGNTMLRELAAAASRAYCSMTLTVSSTPVGISLNVHVCVCTRPGRHPLPWRLLHVQCLLPPRLPQCSSSHEHGHQWGRAGAIKP